MTHSFPTLIPALALALALGGCAASATPAAPPAPAAPAPAPAAPAPAAPAPAPAAPAAPTASEDTALAVVEGLEARIDAPAVTVEHEPDRVLAVDGVLLVNKQHPLAKDFVPEWATERNGLHPQVTTSLDRLIADAKADGVKLLVRSAYRSYADQAAIFAREMKRQPAATVRLYYAEAGRSEHQTGLAVDLWDGAKRGYSFARTPQAKWLAEHAWAYGFIIRYPEGRTDVTGYAYESWHLRYVGTEISAQFGPHSSLTLEEFLGVA